MKITDLVKKLMAKAGVTHEGELTDEVPDELATQIDNALLTIQAATNNHPQVKKVYFAQAYNGLDAEINELRNEFAIPDDVWQEIEKAGGSTKRIVALTRKIKELSDKSKPEDKEASSKYNATIKELHEKLANEVKKQTDLKADFDNQLNKIKVQTKLNSILGNYKTVFDELDPAAKEAGINAILTKALQDSDADFAFDEKGNLSLIKKDGTNLFGDNHTLLTPQSFIDKSLSKILKVTDPSKGNNPPAKPVNGEQNTPNPALKAALAESLQSYETATKAAITV